MASNKSKIYLVLAELKYIFFKKKYFALVDITNKCNLRCKYCYHKENLFSEDNTTLDQWKERFRRYYTRGIRYITFVGGEPSLRYDVLKLAEIYFPFVDTFTNGQIKIPTEFNHRILLSLEGLRKEHDEIYGEGTFERAVGNYIGDKRAIVSTTLSRINYKGPQRLREFIDFSRTMNVRGIRFTNYIPKIKEDNSLLLTQNQRQEIGEVLLEETKKRDSILLMSRGAIDFFAKTVLPIKSKLCVHERIYFFDAQNKIKNCTNPEHDCSRCLSLVKYNPPLYNLKEWFSHKWSLSKTIP